MASLCSLFVLLFRCFHCLDVRSVGSECTAEYAGFWLFGIDIDSQNCLPMPLCGEGDLTSSGFVLYVDCGMRNDGVEYC